MSHLSGKAPFCILTTLKDTYHLVLMIWNNLQELMDDPHVAADGFTYELEAIKEWFDSNHNTSPMTNLQLDHTNLIPNHSLRSIIQEWKEGVYCSLNLTSQATKEFF